MTAQVYEKLLKINNKTNIRTFKAWLFTITRNACISSLRKEQTTTASHENWVEDEKKQANFMENEGLSRLINNNPYEQVEAHLLKALAELPSEQQSCIQLFFFEKKSYKKIVEETGYSLKEVKSFLQNGKRQLYQKLKQYYP